MTLTLERTEVTEDMATKWVTNRTYKNPDRELLVVDHDSRDRDFEVNREHLQKIKDQIIAAGKVYQPLTAWVNSDGQLVIDDGRTRLKALDELKEAGYKYDFNVHIMPKPDSIIERIRREFMLNEGKPLEKIEKGRKFLELLETINPDTEKPYTQRELAAIFGIAQSGLNDCVTLARGIEDQPEIKEAVETGQISQSEAVQKIRQANPKNPRKKPASKKPNVKLVGGLILDSGRLVEEEGKWFIEVNEDTARVCFPEYFEQDNETEEGDF